MIHSFHCKETQKVFRRQFSRKLPLDIQATTLRKLWILDAAMDLDDLLVPPNNRLETLRGNRSGQHSIRINDQWRICFRWHAGHAYDVQIVDYH